MVGALIPSFTHLTTKNRSPQDHPVVPGERVFISDQQDIEEIYFFAFFVPLFILSSSEDGKLAHFDLSFFIPK